MTSPPQGPDDQTAYVEAVLGAYRRTPGTTSHVRPADRRLACDLGRRNVPLAVVEAALLLATARRLARPNDAPPLGPVRSLAYFAPVIAEILAAPLPPAYLEYLAAKLARLAASSA